MSAMFTQVPPSQQLCVDLAAENLGLRAVALPGPFGTPVVLNPNDVSSRFRDMGQDLFERLC